MDLRDVHYEYVVDVMEQDPEVIQEMCYLLDEIQIMIFVCSVDVAVCETLVDTTAEMLETVWKTRNQ